MAHAGGDDASASHEFSAANGFGLIFTLLCCFLVSYAAKKHPLRCHCTSWFWFDLPESGAAMLLGMIAGGVMRAINPDKEEVDALKFNPNLFFFVLLPPIIFDAGFSLKKKRFFKNLGSILVFAVVGTVLSAFVIGFGTLALAGHVGIPKTAHSTEDALLFGALISAVDPVATLAIIGNTELNCDPTLYSLVFGESVLNDAVAIVLFRVFQTYTDPDAGTCAGGAVQEAQTTKDACDDKGGTWAPEQFTAASIPGALGKFLGISLGSVFIGFACGLLCSFVVKRADSHKLHDFELSLLLLTVFGCFSLAEMCTLSGVMAVFFCGIAMAHYCFYNLSRGTKVASVAMFETLATLAETAVFAYMGMTIPAGLVKPWKPGFIVIAILLCFLGRAVNIFPLSWLANCRRKRPIPKRMQGVMWFAGLRGAVAFALAMALPRWDADPNDSQSQTAGIIQSTTLAIVMFTTFFLGGTTDKLLSHLDMKGAGAGGGGHGAAGAGAGAGALRGRRPSETDLREDFDRVIERSESGNGPEALDVPVHEHLARLRARETAATGFHKFWKGFDARVMKPVFGGHEESQGGTLSEAEMNRLGLGLGLGEGVPGSSEEGLLAHDGVAEAAAAEGHYEAPKERLGSDPVLASDLTEL